MTFNIQNGLTRWTILGSVLFFVSACIPHGLPTVTPARELSPYTQEAVTLTKSIQIPTPIMTLTPTLSIKPSVFPDIAVLPSGQYVIYGSQGKADAYSIDSRKIYKNYMDANYSNASPDGRYITNGVLIFDTRTRDVQDISFLINMGCVSTSESPDAMNIAISCQNNDLYALSLKDRSTILISKHSEDSQDEQFQSPLWSPDGKWIAYIRNAKSENQLFLVDTSCLTEPSTCLDKELGPIKGSFAPGVFSFGWSPDSRYIAIANEKIHAILIYDNQKNATRNIRLLGSGGSSVFSIAWSPDGKWLAFSSADPENQGASEIYLISSSGGNAVRITDGPDDKTLLFTISVP